MKRNDVDSKVLIFSFLSNNKCADLVFKFYRPNINIILIIIAVGKEICGIVLHISRRSNLNLEVKD